MVCELISPRIEIHCERSRKSETPVGFMRARTSSRCGLHESEWRSLGARVITGRLLVVVTAISLLSALAAKAITLALNPASITNDYVGTVALNIGGLTPGMTVTVESYADMNSNGIIDAGDLLWKRFQVTDGQVPLVAGVRNLNVPGDEDGLADGQIRTGLNFPATGGSFALGQGLFRVFDPAGSLTSVTQAFSITQKLYPQGVTGRLTWAATGLPLSNGVVGLQPLVGTTTGFTLTDTNGHYRFYCLPGIYIVGGLNNNGAIYSQSALITVGCGQLATNNLVVTNGTSYIAGRVTDSATGLGIPALSVDANTAGGLDVLASTDTNGDYVLQVTANTWGVHPGTGAAPEAGYVDPKRTNVTVTSASVSNVNFVLSKPTALIYGTVRDSLNNPVLGVQLSARDQPNAFHSVGRSFVTNASYSLGVQAATWNPAPDSGDLALRGFTGSSSSVTLLNGQATNINFIVTRTNWPILQAPIHPSGNGIQFILNGLAGQDYSIEQSSNLASSNWLAVLATNAPCDTVLIQDSQATNGARFYRAVVVP